MDIHPKTKLFDLLAAHPELEEQIMNIAPPFQNLKNPALRRTVGKIATLEQVAKIGGMDVEKLVNTLRRAIGQQEMSVEATAPRAVSVPPSADDPDWITGEPQFVVDGTAMIQRGEVPLAHINELLRQLSPDAYILLLTNFEPAPMIEAMQKQGRRVFYKTHPADSTQHLTFIG